MPKTHLPEFRRRVLNLVKAGGTSDRTPLTPKKIGETSQSSLR